MPILINPYGRLVPVDNAQEAAELLKQGFTTPSPQQERDYMEMQRAKVARMSQGEGAATQGVYLATVSHIGGKDGYGVASRAIRDGLEALGIPVSTHYTGQKIAILFHNPYSLPRIEAPYRIIYTMFESTKIPADWFDYLHAADKVIVPSKWCQSIFLESGIETDVIPLGYDDKLYKYHERPDREENRENFTFLHYNAFNLRKGFREIFTAFNAEFEKTEPVRMIYKTTLDHTPLPIIKSEYPNIEVIRGQKSEKELLDIINRSDCFVFPSMGEGFGLTPLETMATGMPAILPNAHGLTEYFNPKCMYEVEIEKEVPAVYSRYKGQDVGKMYMSSIDDLRKKMRWVVNHQAEARAKGKLASEYVKQWTAAETAKKLKSLIDDILTKPLPKRRESNLLTLEQVR